MQARLQAPGAWLRCPDITCSRRCWSVAARYSSNDSSYLCPSAS